MSYYKKHRSKQAWIKLDQTSPIFMRRSFGKDEITKVGDKLDVELQIIL